MSGKKIIAVTTATGEQGGSVVRELLKDGTFAVRALTRNPSSAKSQELAKQGVEVVKADTGDLASLEKAFEGVWGVFGNTVWALFAENQYAQQVTRDAETQHGKNVVDAAKKSGVQAFVWSTLDKTPTEVYHFLSKYDVGLYLEKSGIPNWTLLYTSCYFSNLTKPGIELLKKMDSGYVLEAGCPTDVKIDFFDAGETGYWVLPIFKDLPKYNGKRVDAAGEAISVREMATQIQSLTGVTVTVPEVTPEQFLTDEYRKASMDELWLNWAIWVRGEFSRDYKQSYDVAISKPSNFEQFLKRSPETFQFLGAEYKV